MQFRMALVASLLAFAACNGKEASCESLSVVVTVTDPDNAPLTDAVVTALPSLSPIPENEVVCAGANGVFTCDIPAEGMWKIYAEATSFEPYGTEIEVGAVDAEGVQTCETPLSIQLQRESAV